MDSSSLPLVSIVFTSYNHQEFLEQALSSLISQTYANTEIIIIDDCSTDGSQEILKRYKQYPNIYVNLSAKNSGSYVKASNLGASFAKGDYLLFAQCDDFAEPDQIEKLMKPLLAYENVGVSFCRSNMIDENGKILGTDFDLRESSFKYTFSSDARASGKQMRIFLSKSCVIPNLSAAIVRKKYYETAGRLSEDYLVAADWAFWLALSELCDFFYNTKTLNNFRQHKSTIRSTVKIKKQVLEIYHIFYKHIKKHNIKGKDKDSFRVGAGAIFLSYFSLGKISWMKSSLHIIIETYKIDKLNAWYISRGLLHKISELIKRKS